MNKIIILIIILIFSGIGIGNWILQIEDNNHEYNDYSNNSNGSGCCIDPPCSECFEKLGYCKCDEWAKTRGFICGECEVKSPDCGKNNVSEFCELD